MKKGPSLDEGRMDIDEALAEAYPTISTEERRVQMGAIAAKDGVETLANPELERKVEAARQELAKKYGEYGAKPEDFNLVTTFERYGRTVHFVTYTAPNGLDLGNPEKDYDKERSYNSVMSDENRQAHVVVIDGKECDTREGLTKDVYTAFIEAERKAGRELPDSVANKITIDRIKYHTGTLVTGGRAEAFVAQIANVNNDGSVHSHLINRGDGNRCVRFRPTVKLQLD